MDITDTIISVFIVGIFAASVLLLLQVAGIFSYSVTTWGYWGTQSALSYKILSAPCISQVDSMGMPLKFNYDATLLEKYSASPPFPCINIPSSAQLAYISGTTVPYKIDSSTKKEKIYTIASTSDTQTVANLFSKASSSIQESMNSAEANALGPILNTLKTLATTVSTPLQLYETKVKALASMLAILAPPPQIGSLLLNGIVYPVVVSNVVVFIPPVAGKIG